MSARATGTARAAAALLVWLVAPGAPALAAPPPAQVTEASAPPPAVAFERHVEAPLWRVTRRPGDGRGAYATGHYRNLFTELLGVPQEQVRARIEETWRAYFHGDGQEQRLYFETGANADGPLAYVTDWANNDARSEGMSYGMMIAVQLGHKREFDALWNWAKTYMQVTDPANPSYGYFAWSMGTDGSPRSTGAAPDGEEYFAMALYFAANRWGNGKGIYDYRAEADRILVAMRHRAVMTGTPPFRIHPGDAPFVPPDRPWPSINNRAEAAALAAQGKAPAPPWRDPAPRPHSVGPMMEESHAMVRFVADVGYPGSDASYHLPAFYELWARWGPEADRPFWALAADVSRDYFVRVTNPRTGLAPDHSYFDGSAMTTQDGAPYPFGYDSWRTASNWSVDASWWGKDPRQPSLSTAIQRFLASEGIDRFADRYTLEGKPLSTRHSPGMVAATAVAGLAGTPEPLARDFVKALWDTPRPEGEQRYFDGLLTLMSMMHLAGEFRVIAPPSR
ncbi:glycosyl hydrolase family 8 [Novosphingobium huizhouense]|uniref:glycosyl hydrolase family 8 n=1 Tax=Novosphingobium huizhouense TaxID=2866625 RepID=UPI001CD83DA3|nr:glycosyl hydrolase family 8 [Novosphingobium huizhouense]